MRSLILLVGLLLCASCSWALEIREGQFWFRGEPVTLLGDSFQGALGNYSLDYEAWLDDTREEGLNCIAFWGLWPVRQWADGRNADSDRWGTDYPVEALMPWARTGKTPGFDGLPRYDFGKWDERYWQRIRDLCQAASDRGLIVQISLFDECLLEPDRRGEARGWWWHPFCYRNGGPINNDHDGFEAYDLASSRVQLVERRYARRMLLETAEFDNVCFELCNEGSTASDEWNLYWLRYVKAHSRAPIAMNADFGQAPPEFWLAALECDYLTFHPSFDLAQNVELWRRYAGKGKPVVIDEANPEYQGLAGGTGPEGFLPVFWAAALCGGHYMLQDDSPFGYGSTTTRYTEGHQGRKLLAPLGQLCRQGVFRPASELVSEPAFGAWLGKQLVVFLPEGCQQASLQASLGPKKIRWLDVLRGEWSAEQSQTTISRPAESSGPAVAVISF
jgi:hypothetical protein